MNNKKDIANIIMIGGAYIAFVIGSGFATGQEIMQFFTAFGYWSYGACLISWFLYTWFGYTLLKKGRELKFQSDTTVFKYYCGDVLGTFFDWFTAFYVFAVFVIMLSGAGASLSEYYGINTIVGRGIMAVLAVITVLMGLKRLVDIIGIIGPVIIVFSLAVGIISTLQNLDGLKTAGEVITQVEVASSTSSWITSGLLYMGYMTIVLLPFMIQLSLTAKNDASAAWGGAMGGFALILAIVIMNTGLLASLQGVHDKAIPSLYLAGNIHPALAGLFTIIIMAGIYSSAIPMLWMVCNRFAEERTKKYNIICVAAVAAALVLSALPFGKLVNIVYPFVGYFGILILICVFYRSYINKGNIKKYQEQDAANMKKFR